MKVWYEGKFIEMYVGQVVTVYRYGAVLNICGELATLTRTTKRHLVFTTDSGAIVKTRLNTLHGTIGRAKESGYFVSLKPMDSFPRMIHEEVLLWNKTTRTFVKK